MGTRYALACLGGIALLAAVWLLASYFGSGIFDDNSVKARYNNASKDMIVIDNVPAGVTVLREFIVSGAARGQWYFEASFPVEVMAEGRTIASGHASAQGDWMTEAFVPFIAEVKLNEKYSGPATLVLHRDNPSGDAGRDASLEVPIFIQEY